MLRHQSMAQLTVDDDHRQSQPSYPFKVFMTVRNDSKQLLMRQYIVGSLHGCYSDPRRIGQCGTVTFKEKNLEIQKQNGRKAMHQTVPWTNL